ncbi:MAG: right-handed parallel beta-helix repeat-containing protein [Thermoleophilaceae bacterium]
MRRGIAALVLAAGVALMAAAVAFAHVERTAYWPNPQPDRAVSPAAGGKVPKARSLASALRKGAPGTTRVVCHRSSLKSAFKDISDARNHGYVIRPSQPRLHISKRKARSLRNLNRRLYKHCGFHQIQPALTKSRNNDRVVIMPGVYTEPESRAKPTHDPRCAKYQENGDHGAGGLSYLYQFKCPNDQSLLALPGRVPGKGKDPPPRDNRHGIPNSGRCLRCNVQIEGSGATPDATVVDTGDKRHPRGPNGIGSTKDVGLRADRADGFVLRNMKFRHAAEHDVYVMETDGYLIDRLKFYYAGQYGELTFANDHGLVKNCEAIGNGDSGVYPGGAVDSGEQRPASWKKPRLNQAITKCDVHHNTLGYSGTMGNATHVYNNDFYDNSTAIATDSFYAGGHPGYPQDSAHFENNRIYSNNFNSYTPNSDVAPDVPVPVGTGILIAGGNNDVVAGNRIWDNWRRGTMLIAVPDAVSDKYDSAESTSHRNRYHDNVMGIAPGGKRMPNGVDFWWDQHPTNRNNCWYHNIGSKGTEASITSDPPPPMLPSNCQNVSTGATYAEKGPELGGCAASIEQDEYDANLCPWFRTPPKPGPNGGPATLGTAAGAEAGQNLPKLCDMLPGQTLSCAPFRGVRP